MEVRRCAPVMGIVRCGAGAAPTPRYGLSRSCRWRRCCWPAAIERKTPVPPPPPAVGVQPAAMKGVARSYEFVGRIKAIGHRRAARPGRGLPREGAVPRRPGRQDRRPPLSDREGPVSGPGGSGARPISRRPQAEAINAQLQFNRSLGAGEEPVHARRRRWTRTRRALDSAKAEIMQNQAALTAGARSISATPTSARRSTAASAAPPTPRAIWSIPPAACWRPSSARIRSMSSSRSACASSRISANRAS